MPGKPGCGGPVPKRSDQRRRRNNPDAEEKAPAGEAPEILGADTSWHPVARRLYEGLKRSGQSRFYEQSDWDTAYMLAESLSRDLKPRVVGIHPETGKPVRASVPMKGASLSAYTKVMGELLMTEGTRRRTKLELQRAPVDEDPGEDAVTKINEYRRRAG